MLGSVPRITVLAALIAGAVLAVPSAAQVGSGKIAYSAGSSGIVVVNPDGSGRTTLRSTGAVPVWSPDGTKLAGVRVTATGGQLFVINADGSGDHIVAESAPNSLIIGSQAWSPDGSRIAYVANNSLYTAGAVGGDVRLVASGAGLAPAWSPDGARALLAYSSGYMGSVYVIAPDGSGRAATLRRLLPRLVSERGLDRV